jgi:molecular chaperone GrpE
MAVSNERESNEDETYTNGDGAGSAAGDEGPGVESQLATLTAERDELKDRMLRIAAEFENWKKRARKEQDDGEAKVRESVLKDVLDVMDNLERAVSAYGDGRASTGPVDGAAVLKGVGLVLRLFQTKLDRYGLKPIVTEGQPFDPRIHEAISRVERADIAPGMVAAELQRGYRIGERLIRPSLVSVATAPTSTSTSTSHPRAPEGGHA